MKALIWPDKKLVKVCKEVGPKDWPKVGKMVKDMEEAMFEYYHHKEFGVIHGVGFAANQIGYDYRIFLMCSNNKDGKKKKDVRVFINPKLFMHGRSIETQLEMCLSIPDQHKEIQRWATVTAKWQDIEGKTHVERLNRWESKIFQHEYDHINGVVCLHKEDPHPICDIENCEVCKKGRFVYE